LVEVAFAAVADFFAGAVFALDEEAVFDVLLAAPFAPDPPPVDFAAGLAVLLADDAFPVVPADLFAEVFAAVPPDLPADAFPAVDLLAEAFPAVLVDLLAEDAFAAGFAEVDLLDAEAALVGAAFLVDDAALVGAAFLVAVDFVVCFLVAIRFSPNRVNLVNLECLVTLSLHQHKIRMLLECYE